MLNESYSSLIFVIQKHSNFWTCQLLPLKRTKKHTHYLSWVNIPFTQNLFLFTPGSEERGKKTLMLFYPSDITGGLRQQNMWKATESKLLLVLLWSDPVPLPFMNIYLSWENPVDTRFWMDKKSSNNPQFFFFSFWMICCSSRSGKYIKALISVQFS